MLQFEFAFTATNLCITNQLNNYPIENYEKKLPIYIALIVIAICSCKKTPTPTVNNNNNTTVNTSKHANKLTVTENGVTKTYTPTSASTGVGFYTSDYVFIVLAGQYPNPIVQIKVIFPTPITAQSYSNTSTNSNVYFFDGDYESFPNYGGIQDNITITSIDSTGAKGTFSGDAFVVPGPGQLSLTNGTFDLSF